MRFLLALSLCLSLATPSARAGEACGCDPGTSSGTPPDEPAPRYSVTWIDRDPAGGFHHFAALGEGQLVGAGQRLWRYDGARWRRQRVLRTEPGDRMLRLGDGRFAVMHDPSPTGSTDGSRRGALELFGSERVTWVFPPDGCTLSGFAPAGVEVLAWGQCAVEERGGRVRVEGVVLRLEGSRFVELAPRPRRLVRALGEGAGGLVMIDDRGVLRRLEAGRWRRGVAGLEARGWRSLAQSGEVLFFASETGEVARLHAGEVTRLPTLPTGAAILELVAAGRAVLLRTEGRLWMWDGQRWRDRGPTPDDCSAVDYCVGHVTQLSSGGAELWALRDGMPERILPRGADTDPALLQRACDG